MPSKLSDSNRSKTEIIAELIFDSFRDPSPGGVRSASNPARYLLYRAGSLLIELRFEFAPESRSYVLAGQVSDAEHGTSQLDKVPVRLRCGPEEPIRTMTNRFGEFSLKYETGRTAQICLAVGQNNDICIPLDEDFWGVSLSNL